MLQGARRVSLLARPSVSPGDLGGLVGGQARPEPPPVTPFLPLVLDVYSYDEDDMVLDPNLAEHLSHFGIDMLKMQKVRPHFPPWRLRRPAGGDAPVILVSRICGLPVQNFLEPPNPSLNTAEHLLGASHCD